MKNVSNMFKKALSIFIVVIFVLSICACAPKDKRKDGEIRGSLTSGRFELQIYSGGYGSKMWENVIAEFEAAYPDLEVVAHLDPNINAQMKTRWMKGTPPDFVFIEGNDIPKSAWLEANKLLDLTSWFETATVYDSQEKIKDKINPGLINNYKNTIRELPIITTAYGMWYDSAFFNTQQLTMPKNYTELLDFSKKCEQKSLSPLCYPGMYSGYLVWGLLMPAIAAYGQEYFDSVVNATSPEVFLDERFVSVMQRFEDYVKSGNNIMSGTVALDHTSTQLQWLHHNALLLPCGLWLKSEMEKDIPKAFEMKYSPSPLITAEQNPTIVTTGVTVGVSSEGNNQVAALEFIRFLYQNKVQVNFAELSNSPIATNADMTGAKLSETAKYVQDIMNDKSITFINKDGSWKDVDAVINDCVNQIVLGRMTATQACDKISKTVRDMQ